MNGFGVVPYVIAGDYIDEDQVLVVAPGTIFKGAGDSFSGAVFKTYGTMIAEGTADEPIIFTTLADDAYGGDTNNDGNATTPEIAEGWGGLDIASQDNSPSIFKHCEFRYGGRVFAGGYGYRPLMICIGSNVAIENCHFYRCLTGLDITYTAHLL